MIESRFGGICHSLLKRFLRVDAISSMSAPATCQVGFRPFAARGIDFVAVHFQRLDPKTANRWAVSVR